MRYKRETGNSESKGRPPQPAGKPKFWLGICLGVISLVGGLGPAMLISLIATGKQKTLELAVQQLRHDKPLIDKYVGSDAEWVSLLVQGCIWMGLWLWCVTCFIRTIKYSKNPEKTAACFALALCASIPIIALLVDPTVNFTW